MLSLWDPKDCSPPGSSVHGIFQVRMLEWLAISFSRGSSWPRDWSRVSYISCTGRQILYHWTTWEAPGGWLWVSSERKQPPTQLTRGPMKTLDLPLRMWADNRKLTITQKGWKKQEDQADKTDEITSSERVNTEYIIKHFTIIISVPGEILKICEIVLEDWEGRGTWGNTGRNCKTLYPQVLGDQPRKVRILHI